MSFSAERSTSHSLISGGSSVLGNLFNNAFLCDSWGRLVAASVVPILASALWYASRTVIEVTDSEQSVWLMMWISTQKSAIDRVRRLRLLSPADKAGRQGGDNYSRYGRRGKNEAEEEDDREGDDRFAPPKLEFLPANNVAAWTLFGWWPISVNSSSDGGAYYYGGRMPSSSGYTLTVWLAPWGTSVAKEVMLQGRQLWLAKRAKKTEIWMPDLHCSPTDFKVLTRPSRPLSTVIVENGIKEALIQDTKRFLGVERWYIGKGIPYRCGILLYGSPGCGKTSLITALAGTLRLPIVFVQLDSSSMDVQILAQVLSDAPRDSIILIEDIDCALRNSPAVSMRRYGREPVTLSGLLNALDGVGAQEGRLLFMTTNHVERLDEALIRPGRVDVKFYLGKASRSAAGELFDQFFASACTDSTFSDGVMADARARFLAQVEDARHSFAALQGVLMMARDDPRLVEAGMRNLINAPENDAKTKHCRHCRGAPGPCSCTEGCHVLDGGECHAVHYGIICDSCGACDFSGARYNCEKCMVYDLCETCYKNGGSKDSKHSFMQIARMGQKPVRIGQREQAESEETKAVAAESSLAEE